MAEHPTASPPSGAFHRSASICTHRRSISAVWGYSSLSIMFLLMDRSISLWTSSSSQVWQKVARFWRALPSSSSSSEMAWKASSGRISSSGNRWEGRRGQQVLAGVDRIEELVADGHVLVEGHGVITSSLGRGAGRILCPTPAARRRPSVTVPSSQVDPPGRITHGGDEARLQRPPARLPSRSAYAQLAPHFPPPVGCVPTVGARETESGGHGRADSAGRLPGAGGRSAPGGQRVHVVRGPVLRPAQRLRQLRQDRLQDRRHRHRRARSGPSPSWPSPPRGSRCPSWPPWSTATAPACGPT